MIKAVCFISLLLIASFSGAQQTVLKFGAGIVPTWGIASAGAEFFQKNNHNKSWQILLSVSGGSLGVDAQSVSRQWITAEKIIYTPKKEKGPSFFYSFFTEAGMRKETPGFSHFPDTAILRNKKQFEINPGVAIGLNFKLGKRWGFEIFAGPKVIIASGKENFYNAVNKINFSEKYESFKPGVRAMTSFSYQL